MLTTRALSPSLDRILATSRVMNEFSGARSHAWVPPMDVIERRDAYLVCLELAGVSPEATDIVFEHNVLTIRGEKPASFDSSQEGELRVFSAERAHGGFERAIRLPEFVDAEKIDASFANGLLTIVVPKAEASRARKIPIQAGVTASRS